MPSSPRHPTDTHLQKAWRRVWQPQRGLFWLVLLFNALSSAMGWALHLMQPTGGLRVLLTLLALTNAAVGWWLLAILWRTSPTTRTEPPTPGETHVQSPAHQQDP